MVPLSATEKQSNPAPPITRSVTFELTFANRDLIWLGDPASPATLVYPKPGARPLATDVQISALIERIETPGRRYLTEARITSDDRNRTVYAFTKNRELIIGAIDSQGRFAPNDTYADRRELLPTWPADSSILKYDPQRNTLYYDVEIPGPIVAEALDFLPLDLRDTRGQQVAGRYSVDFAPASKSQTNAAVSLVLQQGEQSLPLATAEVPRVFRREAVELSSFDLQSGAYLPEAAYRAGARGYQGQEPSVTFAIVGKFLPAVHSTGASLVLAGSSADSAAPQAPAPQISIDGRFDDWRNVAGIDDPRGDVMPYLEYVADVDLLEFKVANDDTHIYLYARVAGQVGRSLGGEGRSYFYAYMDVDRNAGTGFLPTRDDDCYFGVDIGDDCEVQFEFVDSKFRKSFYGFCGLGGDANVLRQQVTLGKSQYGREDDNGVERADYKSEYIYRDGKTEITEDLKLGDSDSIRVAVSPDGREVEVSSTLTGFLKDPSGKPTVKLGQTIDLAVGLEAETRTYPGRPRWGADSTQAIRGYQLRPSRESKN